MAVKTFTTGEVLTAADTNTYLNNGGLVYISGTTIGTTVSSVVVSNCFSSTYDNYRIVIDINSQSADGYARIQYNNDTTANYYDSEMEMGYAATTVTGVNAQAQTVARIGRYVSALAEAHISLDVFTPYASKRTWAHGQSSAPGYFWTTSHQSATTNSNTGFTLSPSTGTWTGGIVRVYGYRQA